MERMTRLLEKGCTMLAAHHDCGAPLFRCRGKIMCPICPSSSANPDDMAIVENDEVVSQDADETNTLGKITTGGSEGVLSSSAETLQALDLGRRENDRLRPSHSNLGSQSFAQNSGDLSSIGDFEKTKQSVRIAVQFKLKDLASDIKAERDLCRLRSQLDCIDAALRVINALK